VSERHRVVDGKVYVYQRERSPFWQCAVYLSGRNLRRSTGKENLALAMDFARDWYQDQLAEDRMVRKGVLPKPTTFKMEAAVPSRPRRPGEKLFREAAAAFLREYKSLVEGERNEAYVASKEAVLRHHLLPFFGDDPLPAVNAGRIQDYRVHRLSPPAELKAAYLKAKGRPLRNDPRSWRRPSRSTIHKEIVCLRQVLKTANRKGWIEAVPDMSEPYRASGKVSHRAWFSPEEYKLLYETTGKWARQPPREECRQTYEQLHDFVLFMANTGLRPDEAARVEIRDVAVVLDAETDKRILEIEVRGKRGVGYCKSMPGAVHPFERARDRREGKPTDLLFGKMRVEPLNRLLEALDLKFDRQGLRRTAYSLRHTYICLRLMQGADIYQIAKNCRTSVEMIEKYYAAHIKDVLHAATINVRRRPGMRKEPSAKRALANAKRLGGERPPSV
jgi:integrase